MIRVCGNQGQQMIEIDFNVFFFLFFYKRKYMKKKVKKKEKKKKKKKEDIKKSNANVTQQLRFTRSDKIVE